MKKPVSEQGRFYIFVMSNYPGSRPQDRLIEWLRALDLDAVTRVAYAICPWQYQPANQPTNIPSPRLERDCRLRSLKTLDRRDAVSRPGAGRIHGSFLMNECLYFAIEFL
jgi:hypothetical protein